MAIIDIVGGGILGLALGHTLLQQGVGVRIWERSTELGGLMGRTHLSELGDVAVDRYYHAILSSDHTLMGLIDELGLRNQLHMTATRMGFYHNSALYPMSTPLDFMRFPPLSLIDRARLALTILSAQRVKNWRDLEQQPVLEWLHRLGGKGTVEHIWKPLLRAKFDSGFEHVPATYIWSRLVRTTSSHQKGSAREQMCFLTGGYLMLIEALARDIEQRGGQINLGAAVQRVHVADEHVVGLAVNEQIIPSEGVVLALQTPIARRLLPSEAAHVNERWGQLNEYLGIVCMLLALRRSLVPYYTLNITDEHIPFTGVIETTNLIDTRYTGGYHLVYLPKYVSATSPYARMDDLTLQQTFWGFLKQMFPDLKENDIAAVRIGRERYVEPLHPVGATDLIPPIASEIRGLYLANNAQIYPQLTNGESVIAYAQQAASEVARTQFTTHHQRQTTAVSILATSQYNQQAIDLP
jgi:protoporphyrinogen oxidase